MFGLLLAAYATMGLVAQWSQPASQTAAFFSPSPRPTVPDEKSAAWAASISIDGGILSDYATSKTRQALEASPPDPAVNAGAQDAVVRALTFSPVNSIGWLQLALLEDQLRQPTADALKMSYFTGPVLPDAMAARIKLVSTTAATDEDVRVFAQSDVRTILTRHARFETALTATYRASDTSGKKFLLDAVQAVDPRFGAILKQYP